nr:MAG TPA: hypothetical protein [Caudoviricetes sp.]
MISCSSRGAGLGCESPSLLSGGGDSLRWEHG